MQIWIRLLIPLLASLAAHVIILYYVEVIVNRCEAFVALLVKKNCFVTSKFISTYLCYLYLAKYSVIVNNYILCARYMVSFDFSSYLYHELSLLP